MFAGSRGGFSKEFVMCKTPIVAKLRDILSKRWFDFGLEAVWRR